MDSKTWYQEHKEQKKEYERNYRQTHKEQVKAYRHQYYRNLKLKILSYYSRGKPQCIICGETKIDQLVLDHKNNDGGDHRKLNKIPAGTSTYVWVRKNDYPSIFQVLCRDCNLLKGFPERKILLFSRIIKLREESSLEVANQK